MRVGTTRVGRAVLRRLVGFGGDGLKVGFSVISLVAVRVMRLTVKVHCVVVIPNAVKKQAIFNSIR